MGQYAWDDEPAADMAPWLDLPESGTPLTVQELQMLATGHRVAFLLTAEGRTPQMHIGKGNQTSEQVQTARDADLSRAFMFERGQQYEYPVVDDEDAARMFNTRYGLEG